MAGEWQGYLDVLEAEIALQEGDGASILVALKV